MIIGEAPGYHESQQGYPFVGPSGQMLQQILTEIGAQPNELFVTNVVKHRPPNNRDPAREELDACWHFLRKQIELVAPKIIVTVGKIAAKTLARQTGTKLPEWGLRGHNFQALGCPVRITWHPAFCMRRPEKRPELVQDLHSALTDARNIQ